MTRSEEDRPLLENRPLIRCEPAYGAIVCLTCNNGFPLKKVSRHLRDADAHHYAKSLYSSTVQSFGREIQTEDWKDLSRPIDGSTLIEGLKVRKGHLCTGCGHRTTSDQTAHGHLKCGPTRPVDLQCWNRNGAPEFWIVASPPTTTTPTHAATTADSTSTTIAPQTGLFVHSFSFQCFNYYVLIDDVYRTVVARSRH